MTKIELEIPPPNVRIGIVAAQFNQFITDQLIAGATDALQRNEVSEHDITLAWVPGAFELPLAADRMLKTGHYDAIVALGAVIRGGTPHFDFVAAECSRGITDVSLKHGKPIGFGVLTTDTVEQALERASLDEGNKGFDVAMAALHMVNLEQRLAGRVESSE